jgi:putative transposase
MARLTRLVVPGHPHLVVQRGLNHQPICTNAEDTRLYLDALREVTRVHGVAVHAYAVLGTEMLMLATPSAADSLSKAMQALGRRYVGAFNKRHQRAGTLFDGRFKATVIDGQTWFWRALVFVETAPARAGTHDSHDTLASSANHHLGRHVDPLIWEHANFWTLGNTPFEREAAYKLLLERGLDAQETQAIAEAGQKGWPLGSETFLNHLSQVTPRRLVPLKRGRRAKSSSDGESVPN